MIHAIVDARTYINKQYADQAEIQVNEAVIETEEYLIHNVNLAESLLRTRGFKFNSELRRSLHWLKEGRYKQRVKSLGNTAMTAVSPYENIPADPSFRRDCRDTRDILVGGGRIKHPDAKELAQYLHGLRFGKNQLIRLESAESGMLVGLMADKWNQFMNVISRLESAEDADPQIEKLRLELPDQFGILNEFNLDTSLNNLMALVQDINDRQLLLSAFKDRRTGAEALKTISDLWKLRNGIEIIEEEELPAEESDDYAEEPETPQNTPEYIPTEEEQVLIDEAMMEIADQLEWIVFPAGVDKHDILRRFSGDNVDLSRVNWERIEHLLYLSDNFDGRIYRSREPKLGTSVPYLVAKFSVRERTFAVAECPEIGNATYIVDNSMAAGTWEELMRLSKADARSLGARRIIHPKEDGHLNKILRTINSLLLVKSR